MLFVPWVKPPQVSVVTSTSAVVRASASLTPARRSAWMQQDSRLAAAIFISIPFNHSPQTRQAPSAGLKLSDQGWVRPAEERGIYSAGALVGEQNSEFSHALLYCGRSCGINSALLIDTFKRAPSVQLAGSVFVSSIVA